MQLNLVKKNRTNKIIHKIYVKNVYMYIHKVYNFNLNNIISVFPKYRKMYVTTIIFQVFIF